MLESCKVELSQTEPDLTIESDADRRQVRVVTNGRKPGLAGARNIIAIDPVEYKREQALTFGATHTANSIGEAFELIQQVTWGRMCDKVICCVGVGDGDQIAPIMRTKKMGVRRRAVMPKRPA